jgi:hypothetical protein
MVGCRLLILGESHYTRDLAEVGTTPDGFTTEVVEHFAIRNRHQFFGKLHEIVVGTPRRAHTAGEKEAFWSTVAFYNWVPVLCDGRPLAAGGAQRRPTPEMFRAGAQPFADVLNELEPDAVIVCGIELWDTVAPTLPGFGPKPDRDVVYYYDGRTVFARIEHPSYPNFKPAYWYPRIHRLIELTAEPRQVGTKVMWKDIDGSKAG